MAVRNPESVPPRGARANTAGWQGIQTNRGLMHRLNELVDIEISLEIC